MADVRTRPNPFEVLSLPPGAAETATLDGKRIDLIEAFQTLGWEDLSRIEMTLGGRRRHPYREGDPTYGMPYATEGPGTMTREFLRDVHGMTDAELQGRVAATLGIRIDLVGGEDDGEKRCTRNEAYNALMRAVGMGNAR